MAVIMGRLCRWRSVSYSNRWWIAPVNENLALKKRLFRLVNTSEIHFSLTQVSPIEGRLAQEPREAGHIPKAQVDPLTSQRMHTMGCIAAHRATKARLLKCTQLAGRLKYYSLSFWRSYPMSATRCRMYSDAWPMPRGNMTRLFAPIPATLGGSCRGEPADGMMADRAPRNREPAVSISSDWFSLLHFL